MAALSRTACGLAVLVSLLTAGPAAGSPVDDVGDQWLPRSDGAQWTYQWTDSEFSPAPHVERYTITGRNATAFCIQWTEIDQGPGDVPSTGVMDFKQTEAGLVNTNYQSSAPPPQFPILCAAAGECGNSLAGAWYQLIWGTRSPVIAEPLLTGTRWNTVGGASNDVASRNRYVGRAKVTVPAFAQPLDAAVVESSVTQTGALGDPYGSGSRTVWWVRGVGPVRIVFKHSGGQVSEAVLRSTTLAPRPLPPDTNLLPLNRGDTMTLRWRNSRHLKRWSTQKMTVADVVNNTARVDVKQVSGPITVAGSYAFSTRLDGVRNLAAAVKAATRASFPALGPRAKPADERRRFLTPLDLMIYGFGPIVPVGEGTGYSWASSRASDDWNTFGVTGRSTITGTRTVKVPAGRFSAAVIRSTLDQSGFRFGSGTRTMYFAPGKGLVKLVFKHRDGSVSTVERVK
jgi:hypothetical protein